MIKRMDREAVSAAVVSALKSLGRAATIPEVARHIWEKHEADLKASGDMFYTWQYEMRWAAQRLSKAGKLIYAREGGRNLWQLV